MDHSYDENVEEFMDAEGVPEEMREQMKEMDINFTCEELADDPGKYDWKVEVGEVC